MPLNQRYHLVAVAKRSDNLRFGQTKLLDTVPAFEI